MQKECTNPWCQARFEVFPEDREMLQKFDCPEPVMCPDCRHQQRAMFSPQMTFYRNTSALSGEPIITVYHPSHSYKVFAVKEWWGDAWDALTYGRPFDFSRPFFPQFEELYREVPKMANQNENCENCEFSYACGNAKNAYYSRTVFRSEDVYYSMFITGYNEWIIDCIRCYRSSDLYECIQCQQCYESFYLFRCSETRDSHFCIDCRGCSECLFCSNIRNKSYHVRNQSVSKEEYKKIKAATIDGRHSSLLKNLATFSEVYAHSIFPNLYLDNCEDCVGDALTNCSHCFECYFCHNCDHCRYCWTLSPSEKQVSSMDMTMGGIGELVYNCTQPGGENYFLRMCVVCRKSHNLTYCIDCFSCRDCFGCTGLKHKEYCILNRQYGRSEYEVLVPKIINHMKNVGEWGAFFPTRTTPFAYNESMAMFYLPLAKEEALRRGWRWEEPPEYHSVEGAMDTTILPDSINEVSDDLCTKVLRCKEAGRPFRIIPQELTFYRRIRLPLPRVHPDVRMARRRAMLNPYRLFDRSCAKCTRPIRTSYAPERPEIVYCEQCYLQTVY